MPTTAAKLRAMAADSTETQRKHCLAL
jgi:hypothetical protein